MFYRFSCKLTKKLKVKRKSPLESPYHEEPLIRRDLCPESVISLYFANSERQMPLHKRCKAGHFHSFQLAPLLQPCNEPGIISKLNNSI